MVTWVKPKNLPDLSNIEILENIIIDINGVVDELKKIKDEINGKILILGDKGLIYAKFD